MGQTQRIPATRGVLNGHDLYVMDCWQCGEVFAVANEFDDVRRRDGGPIYCPNGHIGRYNTNKSIDQRRIAELERALSQEKANAESAYRQRAWAESQTKGANIAAGKARAKAARLQHRVECGTCPNCHRTFKQLAAHMLEKHGVTGNAACGVGRDEQKRKRAR